MIAHNTLSLEDVLAQGYNSNPFSRTRKVECIALGFFVCWSMAFRWSRSANQSDRATASIGGGGLCVEKTHKPPWKTHGGIVERKKKIKSFFSPPQPPTRRDFHREAEDKPACRQPRFLRFPSVNYFFLFFSVLRCALLHLTILSSLDLPYPILSSPGLPLG